MKITFILPRYLARPVGGFLVVYRYANELASRGHHVNIVHPSTVEARKGIIRRLRAEIWVTARRLQRANKPSWLKIDSNVRVIFARNLEESYIPDADAVFATACTTASAVLRLTRQKGKKLYLIQGYEDWLCGKREVDITWKMPLHKIVTSKWLYGIGLKFGEQKRLTRVPIGVDLDVFNIRIHPGERTPVRVVMLAHEAPVKGMNYGIEALENARGTIPALEAIAFGASKRPRTLPKWVKYVENPTRDELAELYNSAAIFLHTSIAEGWGLTGAEAMACGCAVVASDSGGVRDYAVPNRTALVVPTRDSDALATGLVKLVNDQVLRLRLALAGHRRIQSFTWTRAADRLESVIRDSCRSV